MREPKGLSSSVVKLLGSHWEDSDPGLAKKEEDTDPGRFISLREVIQGGRCIKCAILLIDAPLRILTPKRTRFLGSKINCDSSKQTGVLEMFNRFKLLGNIEATESLS
jgi:hypothetical protein